MDERQLIEMLKEGDPISYEILFQKYYARFYNFIRKLTRDSQVAEDIAQNVFMKVWLNRISLRPELPIYKYIYVLTKHEVLNYIRDKKVYQQVESLIIKEPSAVEINEEIDIRNLDYEIRTFVSEMPTQRRRVFILSRYKGLSNKEIAEMLGLSVRTVERHLNLALNSLKKEFLKNEIA